MDTKNKQPFIEQGEGNIGIHDVNQDSHDTIMNHTVNQNQTFVYSGEAAREKLMSEKIDEYRQFCKQVITSQIIDKRLKLQLQAKALSLSLDESIATKIEENVKNSLGSSGLSSHDFRDIDSAIAGIKENDVKPIINRMVALADRSDADEVQYYANLLLVAEDPRKCIVRYEHAAFDTYWQMFWVYVAYIRQRNPEKAESVRSKLNDNLEKSEDLLFLLSGTGHLVEYFANNGAESYRKQAIRDLEEYKGGEPLVERFVEALKRLLKQNRPLYFTNDKEVNFYFRLFGAKEKPSQSQSPFSGSATQSFSSGGIRSVSEIAREVAKEVPSRPAYPPISQPVSKDINLKKWAYIAIAVIALIWFFSRNGSSDKSDKQEVQTIAEVTETPMETIEVQPSGSRKQSSSSQRAQSAKTSPSATTNSESNASLNQGQNQTTSSNRAETTLPTTSAATTQSVSATQLAPTVKEPAPAPAELSAAELLSKGKSAVKKFKAEQGAEYFRQAIAKGSIEANYYLGELYYNGNGVAKSFPTAKSYFQKAANAGMADAQYMMGVMIRNGQGGDKNINEARRWLQKAAAQGNTNAERLLNQLK